MTAAVRVDPDKCCGHALCLRAAPDVFRWHDADDRSYVADDIDPADFADEVARAVQGCPEGAIVVE